MTGTDMSGEGKRATAIAAFKAVTVPCFAWGFITCSIDALVAAISAGRTAGRHAGTGASIHC